MKNIIFIDASHVSAASSYEACLSMGVNALFIINPDSYKGDTLVGIPHENLIYADTTNYHNILLEISTREINNIIAVFSLTDRAMRSSILVGSHLQVCTLDLALLFLLQKEIVSNLIPEFTPKTLPFTLANLNKVFLCNMVEKYGKVVIKPSETSASIGSFFIKSKQDVDNLVDYITNTFSEKLTKGTWLAQQYIDGEFFSVEGYVCNRHVTFLGITYRKRLGNTLTAAYFPGESKLSESIIEKSQNAIRELVKRSGYKNGYFHSEFISDSEKPFLIDANFGRIAGGAISQLIADAYSISLSKVMEHVLSLSLFGKSCSEFIFPIKYRNQCLGITYGVDESCIFEKVSLPQNLRSRHITLCNAGDQLYSTGIDGAGWVGILAGNEVDVSLEIKEIKIININGSVFNPVW
ncbi:ATP-grasp domain-containing protein [Serratia fonticola]|uniref:ATP-grasp domain-containing protein n=1 Tax=Serratia fonticola TaxID=47917 RepID=A0AAW3WP27_SERFO|nr:ATP-grasp domain-containing protein [Serratia fonticola]MBC3212444.1 ATP-grasp domain-containing protein [Serratia fonticola]NYA12982.1 ATP-grasp domain-containing protein [Serratia fonticola]NYA32560.1 ATP-grasp domain-containing protein [Serratia fonticola]